MFTLADVETALPMVHAAKPNSDDGRMFTTLKPHAQRSATADQGQKATYTVTPTVRPLYSLEQTFLRTVPMSAKGHKATSDSSVRSLHRLWREARAR